jgi:hypothetical protein
MRSSENERLDRCRKCKFAHYVYSFDNWKFVGCSKSKWKWVIEIENCPLLEDNQ